MTDEFKTLKKFDADNGRQGFLYSLPVLEERGIGPISRLPVSIRIVLESVLRNCDGRKISAEHVRRLLGDSMLLTPAAVAPELTARFFELPLREAREAFERIYFEQLLGKEQSNMSRVAERAGLERTHLYRKLKQLNIRFSRRSDEGAC